MTRRTRVVLGIALILVGNSAYLWADGVVKALFVLGVAPAGILLAGWPSRGRRGGAGIRDASQGWRGQWPGGGRPSG